jgi:hypothetical protein
MYEFMREFAALGPQLPELQQLFRTVHGSQAAMDGFEEYRSDFAAAAKKAHSVAATPESIQSVEFGSGVEPGSRRDHALRASRIETKIDRLTQESGDISKISLISCFFFPARHLFNG